MHLGITVASGKFASLSLVIRFRLMAITALAGLCFISFARAGSVYHNADDGVGFAGFAADTNWTPGGVPTAGNDYFVVNFTLRTGTGGAGSPVFAGDSLNIVDGGRFYLYNAASTDVITVPNLIIDAGEVRSNSPNAAGAISNLAGAIRVTSNGAIFYQSNTTNDYLNIQGNIFDVTGSPGGPVALGGNDSIGGAAINKKITLSGTNAYTGPTLLLGGNVQLASSGALSPSTKLIFGSGNTANSNGNATLDLNGGSYSVNGIAVQSYTAQVNQPVTLPYPNPNPAGIPTSNNRNFHLTNPIVPGSIQIGQTVTEVLSTGTPAAPTMVIGIDYTTNDIILGDNTAFNNTTANVTGLTFNATQPLASGQTIGNSSTTSDATLTITATSSFAGNIVDSVLADPAVSTSGGTKKTNIAFTAPNGTLTLSGTNTYTGTTSLPLSSSTLVLDYATNQSYSGAITGLGNVTKSSAGTLKLSGPSTYSGATTINGGSLTLDFSATGAPASNIINNSANGSALTLNGTNLSLNGSATAANSQRFNGLTLGPGASSIVLTTNTTTPQALSLSVGNITRSAGGFLLLTNPSGTISATNGLLTSTGSAGALVTSNGTPFIVVNSNDWGAKDASNQFVTALSNYTASTATTLSGDANVISDVGLAAGGTTSSIRFNDPTARTVTITSGTLTTGGVLMTSAAGTGTISGGSLKTTGAGADLVLVQNSTSKSLNIGSNIVDNSGSGLATAGAGTIVLSGQNNYTGKTSVGSGTVEFTKENSLYNNTPASWTASNISVNGGATLGLNVGGTGEFTASDVATLSALGTTTGGLRNGSILALDTTNAAGGAFALTSPIANTNGGANVINLNKIGVNTLQLAAGPNTYTGTTTVSKGTLQMTGNNSLTGGTAVVMGNDPTATFDLNGNNTTVGGLTGGGTTGGKVSLGTGNLTVVSPSNATYAGSFTSAGGGVNFNLGALGSAAVTQTLTGGGSTAGNLTVANGTVVLSPAAATTWGSATSNMVIAPGNGSSSVLTVGANANVVSQYIMVGGDPATDAFNNFNNFNGGSGLSTGGVGTFNVNASSSHVTAQTLYIGTMARVSAATTTTVNIGSTSPDASPIVELTGTVIPAYGISGAAGNQDGRSFAITMATNQNDNGVLNIAGANTQVKIENGSSIIMGRFYAQTATITQSGGNVTFYSDAGTTVGGTGALIFDTDNPTGNAQNFRYLLNGGTLTVPQIINANTFSVATVTNGAVVGPQGTIVLNGGTLAAAAHAGDVISDFITGTANGYAAPPTVRIGANGGTIETNGATVQINAGIFHDPTLAAGVADGGLTVKSSVPGGILVLSPSFTNANTAAGAQISANTFNGPVNIVSGTLQTQNIGALAGSSLVTVGANGKFDVSLLPSAPSLPSKLTLSGTGHVAGPFFHTNSTSVITGGGVGTAGTLTFDNSLDLAGGVLRADLDQTATSYDKIVVSQNGGFGASGSPAGSVVDIEFMGALPTTKTTYSIVNYSGNFNGPTNNVTFNGSSVVNPSDLVFTSSNPNIAGRNTQLSVNNTTHTLDVIYVPGAVAGNLIWTGGTAHNSSAWDTNNTANWNNIAASINPDKFLIRDNVTFDNSAGVPHAITVNETIAPQTMTVNSDGANAFSFSGTGKISGTGSLTKSGTSTLTLSTSNDYTGGTTISAGTVIALDTASVPGSSSGLGNGVINIAAGAALQVGNGTAGTGTITGTAIHNAGSITVNRPDASVVNAPIDGAGTFAVQGGGALSFNVAANANTYTGNTTVSGGATLQAGAANAMSANSVINIDNTAGSRFNPNGFNQVIAGLSGGGNSSGDVTMAGNNLTFAGIGTNNLNYAGPISSVSGTLTMGTTKTQADEGLPTGTNRTVAASSKDAVQTLSGAAMNLQGPTTVLVGTLNLAPSAPTIIGATTRNVAITAPITLPFGVGTSNPPNQGPPAINQVTQATLTTNANTTLLANNLTLNPGQNSLSNFVENGGTVQVNGTVSLGNSAGGSTLTLNSGTFIAGGAAAVSGTALASIQMGINGGQQAGAPPLTRPYEFNVLNVNGGTMSIVNQLSMGLFFNSPCTVNQNGGTIQFVDGSLNPGGTGGWICVNNNNANFGRYIWNLDGGVLAMNQAKIFLTADANPTTSNLNLAPVMNFNGGTLMALSDQPTEMFDHRYSLVAQALGGTIDTNNHVLSFTAPISHDPTLGSTPDGGMTIIDSTGAGNLTFTVANTYTGPTKIGAGGQLTLNVANAIPTTSTVNLAGGKLFTSGLDQNMSAATKLKVSGNSTLDLAGGGAVSFADSTLSHWATGKKLTINNFSGGHVLVGSTGTSLTPNQLSQVQFAGNPVGAVLTSFGELRPGTAGGTIEKLGDVDHNGTTNAADISALTSALTNLSAYTNNLTLDTGWTSKASEALYLADVNFDDQINNLDLQSLLNYLKSGGNGSNAAGGGSVSPVPEPSTWLLLAVGGLIVVGRRYCGKS
jgi:fibronectin-binding autotransporter adhesin